MENVANKWLEMVNKENLENYLNAMLEDVNSPDYNYIYEGWVNKNDIIKSIFKDSLTIEKQIDFEYPISDNPDLRSESYNVFTALLKECLPKDGKDTWEFIDLIRTAFLSNDGKVSFRDKRFERKTLYTIVSKEDKLEPFSIREGESSVKILNRLMRVCAISSHTRTLVDRLINSRSMILQSVRVKGTLVISVDPNDFFTASNNESNWTSCFNVNDGEYAAGPYSACISPNVFIAYIKSAEPFKNYQSWSGDWEMTNKIWRSWVYVNEDVVSINKNYPFHSDCIEKEVMNLIFGQGVLDKKDYTRGKEISTRCSFMYDDLAYTDTLFYIKKSLETLDYVIPVYSIEPKCLECGDAITEPNSYVCEDCSPYAYCESCGERIYESDAYEHDGCWYCEYCYDEIMAEEQGNEEEEIDPED